MPLNAKGEKIEHAMEGTYGPDKGKRVFYASENKGTITGVTRKDACPQTAYMDACMRGDADAIRGHCDALVQGRIAR